VTELPLAYCERLSHGVEPLNTLSNLVYLLVAVWWARSGSRGSHRRFEAVSVALIGALSALFHTWPTPGTQALDIAGIALFVALALYRMIARLVARPTRRHAYATLAVASWLLASAVAATLTARAPHVLNGSLLYLPTLVALALPIAAAGAHRRPLAAALALFLTALALRTLDAAACTVWPYGTHTLWHLFSALTIVAVLRALSAAQPIALSADTAEAASRERR